MLKAVQCRGCWLQPGLAGHAYRFFWGGTWQEQEPEKELGNQRPPLKLYGYAWGTRVVVCSFTCSRTGDQASGSWLSGYWFVGFGCLVLDAAVLGCVGLLGACAWCILVPDAHQEALLLCICGAAQWDFGVADAAAQLASHVHAATGSVQ